MKTALPHLNSARRIWSGAAPDPEAARLYRRCFDLETLPAQAHFHGFAESRYHLWVNGHYIGRGPIHHHPDEAPADAYDIKAALRPGRNVIAVSVYAYGLATHYAIPRRAPGLTAALVMDDNIIATDETWRVSDRTGLVTGLPKRCWALGPIEAYDLRVAEPVDWVSVDFDDNHWQAAQAHEPVAPLSASPLPTLRTRYVKPEALLLAETVTTTPIPIGDSGSAYGESLEAAARKPLSTGVLVEGDPQSGKLSIGGLNAEEGIILHLDMGREYVGQVALECVTESGGTIDVGWAEYLGEAGYPKLVCKGVSYADRLEVPDGRACYRPSGFSGMRYLSLFFRGFTGSIEIEKLGVIASEPDLTFTPPATFGGDKLDAIFELCHYTNRIGTQEAIMDCPTREQSTYIGDGHPVAHWVSLISGDVRHWRRLMVDQFHRQAPNGLLRSAAYSGRDDTLIDYSLIGVIGTRDFLQSTGEVETVRPLVEPCRRVVDYFEKRLDANGLFGEDWRSMDHSDSTWEHVYDPSLPRLECHTLFIDHPGMGWHNIGAPGIDRSGTNAAINALLCLTHEAMADLEQRTGEPGRVDHHRQRIDQITAAGGEAFVDIDQRCFVDGVADGRHLTRVSQQTNTWALLAGWADDKPELIEGIINHVLLKPGPEVARSGPYFWLYGLPLLARYGRHQEALDLIREQWQPMLDGGATALWETYDGGEYDSWCHPWAAAPMPFLLRHILGLPTDHQCGETIRMAPRCDLLPSASGRVITRQGPIEIEWSDGVLKGSLPPDVSAILVVPKLDRELTLTGNWQVPDAF